LRVRATNVDDAMLITAADARAESCRDEDGNDVAVFVVPSAINSHVVERVACAAAATP
jgi:malic enzyme